MLLCPDCKQEYKDEALTFCPTCGTTLIETQKEEFVHLNKEGIITSVKSEIPVKTETSLKVETSESNPENVISQNLPKILPKPIIHTPLLASTLILEDLFPMEPAKKTIRIILFISGLLLLLLWILPSPQRKLTSFITSSSLNSNTTQRVMEKYELRFGWESNPSRSRQDKIFHGYLLVTGIFFILIALIPIPYIARALSSAFLSITPIVIFCLSPIYIVTIPNSWLKAILIWGILFTSTGLLYRKYYRTSVMARLFIFTGIIFIIINYVYPIHNHVPLFKIISEMFSANVEVMIQSGMYLFLIIIVLFSLSGFLGPETNFGTGFSSALLLSWIPLTMIIFYLFRFINENGVKNIFSLKLSIIFLIYSLISVFSLFQLFSVITRYYGKRKRRGSIFLATKKLTI